MQATQETPEIVITLSSKVIHAWYTALAGFEKLPGGALVIRYIRASHKNDPWRTLLEFLLALLAIRYFLASKYSQDEKDKVELSDREVDELIDDWQQEPLVPKVRKDERWQLAAIPRIDGAGSKTVTVRLNGKSSANSTESIENVLNFASKDFLRMGGNETVKKASIAEIRAAGVGACGPPNFYGTQDAHVRVCEDLASFLGAEEGIIYGQDYCTPTSVLPCFLKRGDIAIVDGGVSLALQKAAVISRCDVEWFNHNDLDHLERILASLSEDLKEGPLNRRFIVTEGLFENFGDSPDLKRLVEIKNHYKFRLVLDETNSIGTLGATGRGLPEAAGIPRDEIEITIGSMAESLGSSGGYCVGCHDMIYHQILSSNAYVFSASLPPYCAVAASTAIHLLESDGEKSHFVSALSKNSKLLHKLFSSSPELKGLVVVRSASYSPTLHMRIDPTMRAKLELPEGYGGPGSAVRTAVRRGHEKDYFDPLYNTECYILQQVVNTCLQGHVLITRTKRILHHELLPVVPELILNSNADFTNDDINKAFTTVRDSIVATLKGLTKAKFAEYSSQLEA